MSRTDGLTGSKSNPIRFHRRSRFLVDLEFGLNNYRSLRNLNCTSYEQQRWSERSWTKKPNVKTGGNEGDRGSISGQPTAMVRLPHRYRCGVAVQHRRDDAAIKK